jgi:hypothetical protein
MTADLSVAYIEEQQGCNIFFLDFFISRICNKITNALNFLKFEKHMHNKADLVP